MESILIWLITILVITAILIPYFLKAKKRHKEDINRKEEARALGIDRPLAQFPFIDASRCIGCGSCVAACPERDVLGIIYGKASVINGQRCVGHSYCEAACPVEAIRVGLGDLKTRPDIPIIGHDNQTTIPGVYIAGELSGFSLIRNAVAQGKFVVEQIARKQKVRSNETSSSKDDLFDIIIVGAGPAGLSAALSAIMHQLSYLVLDQQEPGGTIRQYPRQKLVMTQPIEIPLYGWLKKDEYSKEILVQTWQSIIEKFGLNIHIGEKVDQVKKENGCFKVVTPIGQYQARYVILAMGRRGTPRKLGVPGEEMAKVLYQIIDAQAYSGKHVLVVGGGDSAIEAAVGLARQEGNTVSISYRKDRFARIKKKNEDKLQELVSRGKVNILFNSEVTRITQRSVFLLVEQKHIEIPNDFVFVFIGGEPPFEMLKQMGVAFGGEIQRIAG
jgi:putative YpdA family bacillithiol system oxidoreductase